LTKKQKQAKNLSQLSSLDALVEMTPTSVSMLVSKIGSPMLQLTSLGLLLSTREFRI
jgi:hypothetical protein